MIVETEGYATHLAVLERLPFRHVLEFGVGHYSTPFFTERAESVHSVETDVEWLEWARFGLIFADNLTLGWERPQSLEPYDLILVDDGKSPAERVETLAWVLDQPHRPLTVLHDAEVPEYRAVLDQLKCPWELHSDVKPYTAVIR